MPSGFIVKADASNVGLLPPELDFICCSFMAMDSPELEALASRLELAAITDSHLSMASEECPQQGPMFRNEVMYMSYIIRVWMGTIVIKDKCEDTFYNWVKEIQGSSIDNPGIHKKLLRNFGSPKANKDENAFKLATGRILANASIERIKGTYSTIIDEVVDGVSNRRLGAVMGKASESCIYSKIGNQFIFQYFRGRLHSERGALLVKEDTPFREIGEQYDESCNDEVRPITDTLCGDQFKSVDWLTSEDPQHFILAASILREIVDYPIGLLINSETTFSEETPLVPQLFVFTGNFTPTTQPFGIVQDKKLWSVKGVENPIFATLYEFLRRRNEQVEKPSSFTQLVQCCEEDVDIIPATNPFKKFLNAGGS